MDRDSLERVAVLVACSSVVLTAAFVGVVALLSGDVSGVSARLPYYLLGGAAVFVVAVFALEHPDGSGTPIITATLGVSILGFALLSLGGEGAIYAYRNPGDVFASQLVVYFLAAALVCTGTAYWGLNHWREFTT